VGLDRPFRKILDGLFFRPPFARGRLLPYLSDEPLPESARADP
jgi:hypothetical protein